MLPGMPAIASASLTTAAVSGVLKVTAPGVPDPMTTVPAELEVTAVVAVEAGVLAPGEAVVDEGACMAGAAGEPCGVPLTVPVGPLDPEVP